MEYHKFGEFAVLLGFIQLCFCAVPSIDLCDDDTQEYHLADSGFESALSVSLANSDYEYGDDYEFSIKPKRRQRGPCKLKITAPETHIVSVSFATNAGRRRRIGRAKKESAKNVSCMISIYLPDSRPTAIWKVDPCQEGEILPPARLLTPNLRIVWNPPADNEVPEFLSQTQLVLTALGRGQTCLQPGQHACLRIGWSPLMCIADALLCDGVPHCPRDESDEDPEMCAERIRLHRMSWEYLANELMKKFTPQHRNNNLPVGTLDNNMFIHRRIISQYTTSPPPTTTKQPDEDENQGAVDNLTGAFAHYGPWGYLMLGMLICGTVLMVCGLWECCCRKSKPISSTRRNGSNAVNGPRAGTILVIAPTDDVQVNSGPPSYEDLDQPPAYCTLFPNLKRDSLILNPEMLIIRDVESLPPTFEAAIRNANEMRLGSISRCASFSRSSSEEQAHSSMDTESEIVSIISDNGGELNNNEVVNEEVNNNYNSEHRPRIVLGDATSQSSNS